MNLPALFDPEPAPLQQLEATEPLWVARLVVELAGKPEQRGSKHAMVQKRWKGDRSIIWRNGPTIIKGPDGEPRVMGDPSVLMTDDNRDSSAYMRRLSKILAAAWGNRETLKGAVRLTARFYFSRPKKDFHTSKAKLGLLKDTAPREYLKTPDLDKLTRTVADCLTGTVIDDDCQIAAYGPGHGRYYEEGQGEGVLIQVESRPDDAGGGAW